MSAPLRLFQKIARTIYKVNRNTGFAIVTGTARIMGKISPGLNRRLFGRYLLPGGKRMMIKHGKWVVPGLTTALGGLSFGLYHYLRDDRDSLVNEDRSVIKTFDSGDTDTAFTRLDRVYFNSAVLSELKNKLNDVSAMSARTDIEAFTLLVGLNSAYLKVFDTITDPKVMDFASKNLLETTALLRQGLSYESASPEIESQNLYNSYESDPTPQGKVEFLLAMEAASRHNTRLSSDYYE